MGIRSGAVFGTAFSAVCISVLAILGCGLSEMALPYTVLLSAGVALASSWACSTPNSLIGFLIPSVGILVLWGLDGMAAGLLVASWAVLWFGFTRCAGSNKRSAAILGIVLLLCLFSVFYAHSLGPKGGFWLWFSLFSSPVPALWAILGDSSHYFGNVSILLYNRWYGNDLQVALPAWWILSILYLIPGLILTSIPHRIDSPPVNSVTSPEEHA